MNNEQKNKIEYKKYKEIYDNILENNLASNVIPCKGKLREYQFKVLNNALKWFKIFKKENIEFFIQDGALLGAYRNGGFIPWDDDIDVGMMRKDYEKLKKYLKENAVEFNAKNLQYDGKTKYTAFKKFIKNNPNKDIFIQTPEGLQIFNGKNIKNTMLLDVYPYDFYNEECSINDYIEQTKCIKTNIFNSNNTFGFIKKYLRQHGFVKQNVVEKSNKINFGFDNLGAYICKNLDWFSYEDFFPLKMIKFENTELPAPRNIEKFLEINYGLDYMNFPKSFSISGHVNYRISSSKKNFKEIVLTPFQRLMLDKYIYKHYPNKSELYKKKTQSLKMKLNFLNSIIKTSEEKWKQDLKNI